MKRLLKYSLFISMIFTIAANLVFALVLSRCKSCISIGGRDYMTELLWNLTQGQFQITVFGISLVSVFLFSLLVMKVKGSLSKAL